MSGSKIMEINSDDEVVPEAFPRFAVSKGMLVVRTVGSADSKAPVAGSTAVAPSAVDARKLSSPAPVPPGPRDAKVSDAPCDAKAAPVAACARPSRTPKASRAAAKPAQASAQEQQDATPVAEALASLLVSAAKQQESDPVSEESRPCPACGMSLVWSDFAEGMYDDGWSCENVAACGTERPESAFRWFCAPCERDFCHPCFLALPAQHTVGQDRANDATPAGPGPASAATAAKKASGKRAKSRNGNTAVAPAHPEIAGLPASSSDLAATPSCVGGCGDAAQVPPEKKARRGRLPQARGMSSDHATDATGAEEKKDVEPPLEVSTPVKSKKDVDADLQTHAVTAEKQRGDAEKPGSGSIASVFSRSAKKSFAKDEVCLLDSDEDVDMGATGASADHETPQKLPVPSRQSRQPAVESKERKRGVAVDRAGSTASSKSGPPTAAAKQTSKNAAGPAEGATASLPAVTSRKRQQSTAESTGDAAAPEAGSTVSKKDQGHAMMIDQLVSTARAHIRKKDFERAQHVVGVMRDYCKQHSLQMPESLMAPASAATTAARREEDAIAGVDVTGADDGFKGTPEEVARDALHRCFPLKHPQLVPPLEKEDEIKPQAKKVASKPRNRLASAGDDEAAAEGHDPLAPPPLDDGQRGVAAKFASIPQAPNEDYERLHAVACAFREHILRECGNHEKADKHLDSFYQLFQLDDKSFDGMASPEYVALARSEDAVHGDAAAAFSAFWSSSCATRISEATTRLSTNEERNLAAESGVPPGWRVRIHHRMKREDLVILTAPDGTHEYTTKHGLRNMAETVETFAEERRKAEEAGLVHEEARLQAAASLERRRRFAEDRLSFMADDAKARVESRCRLEAAFMAVAEGRAEGVALRGMTSDCNGTYLRLDDPFQGFTAYERLGSPQRMFLFRNGSRWMAAPELKADAQPLAYVDDASAALPHQVDCDNVCWMVPPETSGGVDFVEATGLAWCQDLDHEKLSSLIFSLFQRTQTPCSVCFSDYRQEGVGDEMDDLQDVKTVGWHSYEDVPDATEEERAIYPAILEKFDEEGYPYLAGVKKLMALYGKSPAAMGTKAFHILVRHDPVNAICNGFDSSSILYFITFWEKFGSYDFVPPVRKTDAQLIQMESKERKAYLRAWNKYEVDPNSAYEVKEQGAVLQDLQIDISLGRLIADVTANWKQDLKEFLSETGFLQEDADASGLLATRCGADLLPEPTETEWASWGGVLRAFDEWGRGPGGKGKAIVANLHVEPLRRAIRVHGKAPAVVGSTRYVTVVGWEFGRESAEHTAAAAFAEFWDEKGGTQMPDPTKGLLFRSTLPERWSLPPLAEINAVKKKRRSLQLPATWELSVDPHFQAKEPADQGGRAFTNEASLRAMLKEELEDRRREQQRKNAVAQEWRLPPRFEVEFQEDDSPYVVGPDGTKYHSPEEVPRPVWMEENRAARAGSARYPGSRYPTRTAELRAHMNNAAFNYDFDEAKRLRAQITAIEEDPRLMKAVNKQARESAAQAGQTTEDATCADEAGAEPADAEEANRPAKEDSAQHCRERCRAGKMPIVKKKDALPQTTKQVKYTKNAGIKEQQEKQIEVGELMLKAHCWRLKGIRNSDGDIVPVEACADEDPANVVCVFAQIADEIIPEEQTRIRRLWGLDDTWSVQVRIRLSGNQITVKSPEGRCISRRTQIQAQARLDAESKRRVEQAQCLEHALRMMKAAAPDGSEAVSGALAAVIDSLPARLCKLCKLKEQVKQPKESGPRGSAGAAKQAEYELTLRSLDARRSEAPRDLGTMTEHMMNKLKAGAPECIEALDLWWKSSKGKKLRLGTLCSGTDSPALVLKHLGKVLGKVMGTPNRFAFEHVFSCELDEQKQEFLMKNFDMEFLFSDCTQMGRGRAWDVKSQSVQDVPGDVDVLAAGFSCKDLSFMNSYRKTLEEMGQSGATLRGCFDYVERYRPRLVILENVFAIDRADQHGLKQVNIVMEGLRARGYAAAYNLCNSCDYYVPQVRHRIWMWGVRLTEEQPPPGAVDAMVAKAIKAGAAVAPRVRQLLRMLEEPSALHFDDFMLPDDDPRVQDFSRQMCAKGCRQREKTKANADKTAKRSENAKLTWQQKYSMHRSKLDYAQERPYTSERGARWKMMLNDRLLELLDLKCLDVMNDQSKDPREFPMLWDLLQSVERVPGSRVRRDRQNYAQCLLPPSLLWHTVRHRFVIGQEKLRIQGIFDEDLRDLASFPQLLLGDLAGNAFTTTVCLVNFVSVASVAAIAMQAAKDGPAPSYGLPAATSEEDDGGEVTAGHANNKKQRTA